MAILKKLAVWLGSLAIMISGYSAAAKTVTLAADIPLEGITSLTVTRNVVKTGDQPWTVECQGPDLAGQLVAVLRQAQPSQDHKCPDIGTIVIEWKDGKRAKLGILPGHDERYYEIRNRTDGAYDIFQVDRPAFLAALEALGCPVKGPDFPR